MPDHKQEWHYAKGSQQFGPVTADELKQLAFNGDLSPGDLVWKEDLPEWRRADSIKNLFSTKSVGAQPPAFPQRETLRVAVEAAEKVSQRLWFLDLQFEQFATPRLIGFLFTTTLLGMLTLAIFGAVYALLNETAIHAALMILLDVALLTFLAGCLRVALECCLLGFKMVEHLSFLRHLENDD